MVSYASIYEQVIQTPSNAGSSGIPDSQFPISRYNYTTQVRCGSSLSPHLSCYPSRKVD
jgi:hypothetical protein